MSDSPDFPRLISIPKQFEFPDADLFVHRISDLIRIVHGVKQELPPKRKTAHKKRFEQISSLAKKLADALSELDSYEDQ